MLKQATIRLTLWASSCLFAASTVGIDWMLTPVEVPLIWILILTFVPTEALIDLVRTNLNRFTKKQSTNGKS